MKFIIGLIFELIFSFENKWSKLNFFPTKWKNPARTLTIEDRKRIGRGLKSFREEGHLSVQNFACRVPIGPNRLEKIESGESTATDQELALLVRASTHYLPQLYHYEIDDLEHKVYENIELREKARTAFFKGIDIHYRMMNIGKFFLKREYPNHRHLPGFCHDCVC